MNFATFLRGRWPYIAVFIGFATLAVAVVQLDLWLSGTSLQFGNVLYIFLLGLVGLMAFLWVDYSRHRAFSRHLAGFTGQGPLDDLGVLPEPVTPEHQLFLKAWERLYSRLRAELSAEQARGRRNVDLVTQWAHHMKTPVAVIDLELQRLARPVGSREDTGGEREETVDPADRFGERNGAADPVDRGGVGDGAPGPAEKVRTVLASIGEENQRLSHALQMLLNTVRLQDFAADFKVERVDLAELVRHLINDHRREFIVHRVYPRLDGAGGMADQEGSGPAPLSVETDAKWLRLALEQVISNAIKYSARPDSEEQGQVIFRSIRDDGESGITLEVIDNGIGVRPEDLPRVFNPFFTGSTGRHHPLSTGMGLYLAQEVCRRLGHPMGLESVPGQGTRVFIRFPRTRVVFTGLEEGAAHQHPLLRDN